MYQILNEEALLKYGFYKVGNEYICKQTLSNPDFFLIISYQDGKISTKVFDDILQEEYLPFLLKSYSGSFLRQLREEVQNILEFLIRKCAAKQTIFQQILDYVKEKYGAEVRYPWKKDFFACTLETEKGKWYALLMTIPSKSIGISGNDKISILNVKHSSEKIKTIIDNVHIFPAYHMNKKHWITISLNSDISWEEIINFLEESYQLVHV